MSDDIQQKIDIEEERQPECYIYSRSEWGINAYSDMLCEAKELAQKNRFVFNELIFPTGSAKFLGYDLDENGYFVRKK